jgi:membrane-associated phospholipid phosphatase
MRPFSKLKAWTTDSRTAALAFHTARHRTFHKVMALSSALLLLCCVTLVPLTRVQIPLSDVTASIECFAMFSLIVWYCHWSGLRGFREFCLYVLWLECISTGLIILVAVAGTAPTPLMDLRLARIDAWLGVQTPQAMAAVSRFPPLHRMLSVAYNLSGYFALVALILPALFRRTGDLKRALLGCTFTGMLTLALFSLIPAVGPWTVYGFQPTGAQMHCESSLRLLKSGNPVSVHDVFAIVSFPSFHAALAVLCVLALWGLKPLRVPSIILAVAICISTVTTGWHYTIDVIGGIAVAAIAYAAAAAVVACEESVVPAAHPPIDQPAHGAERVQPASVGQR